MKSLITAAALVLFASAAYAGDVYVLPTPADDYGTVTIRNVPLMQHPYDNGRMNQLPIRGRGQIHVNHNMAIPGDPDATNLAPLTVQGSIVGTLCYMSPEQAQGKPADTRSDIFSFGAVLYEMATGMRAFTGENGISMLSSVLRDEPRRVLEITPDIPAILSDVIHRCLQKEPEARFQTMAELREGLLRLRQLSESGTLYAQSPLAETVIVRPAAPSAVEPPAPSRKIWPMLVGGVFAVLLASVIWYFIPHKRSEEQAPVTVAANPESGNKPSPTADPTPATPIPPPVAPAKDTVALLVPVPNATPLSLELQTDIPIDAEAGLALQFRVSGDVRVGGEIVIANGAKATGELYAKEKKKRFIVARGTKITVQFDTVDAPDGAKLKLNGEPRTIESPGLKSKTLAVAKGAITLGYTAGAQAIRLKR